MLRSSQCLVAILGGIALASLCIADAPTTKPGNLLQDPDLKQLNVVWEASSQDGAAVSIEADAKATPPAMVIKVDQVTATDWNAQVFQTGLNITKGAKYTLSFNAKASEARKIAAFIQIVDAPYTLITEGKTFDLTTDATPQTVEFTATDSSTNGKLTIVVGQSTGTVTLSELSLTEVK